MIIGRFEQDQDSGAIAGTIQTIDRACAVTFTPNPDKGANDKRPDFHVLVDGTDHGAAWWHTTKARDDREPTTILSANLDSPFWPAPIQMALWPQRGGRLYDAIWNRPEPKKAEKPDAQK